MIQYCQTITDIMMDNIVAFITSDQPFVGEHVTLPVDSPVGRFIKESFEVCHEGEFLNADDLKNGLLEGTYCMSNQTKKQDVVIPQIPIKGLA